MKFSNQLSKKESFRKRGGEHGSGMQLNEWRGLPQFPEDGLLFHAKMKQGAGVVVSEASEVLFEGIKKLNAQQRPDVPACFIYTAISYLLMSAKTLYTIFFPRRVYFNTWNTFCNSLRVLFFAVLLMNA